MCWPVRLQADCKEQTAEKRAAREVLYLHLSFTLVASHYVNIVAVLATIVLEEGMKDSMVFLSYQSGRSADCSVPQAYGNRQKKIL